MRPLLLILLPLLLQHLPPRAHAAPTPAAQPGEPAARLKPADTFRFDARLPEHALIAPPGVTPNPLHDSPMLRQLDGVSAALDRPALLRLARSAKPAESPSHGAVPIATLTLIQGQRAAPVDLYQGEVPARIIAVRTAQPALRAALTRTRLDALAPGWNAHAVRAAPVEPGSIVDLPPPYLPGSTTLTGPVVRKRFNRGSDTRYPTKGPTRDLADEHLWIRLPNTAASTRRARGLLIWISPTPNWRLPAQFEPILDELGFIAVGADNAGNKRHIIDRLQLAFDAIETVAARHPIDRQRIYLTGFSGGGRCSTILVGTYPDLFAGAVPIVGLNSSHRITRADGKIIPSKYPKARGKLGPLAESRRIFAISGTEDFNLPEMRARTEKMKLDNLPVRLEVVEGMKHEQMPPPELIAEGLRWVDEPRRNAIQQESAEAERALDEHTKDYGNTEPQTPAARVSLVDITRLWPWTDPAWQAAERLGYD